MNSIEQAAYRDVADRLRGMTSAEVITVIRHIEYQLPKCEHCNQAKVVCTATGGVYGLPCGRF
jgi:hypothetical protein